ncbi:Kinesin-like protein KIN-7E [Bienertia sinuspersici]
MASADEEEANQAMQESNSQGEERILVSVRLRPLNDKEASRREAVDWECIDDNTIMYKNTYLQSGHCIPNSFTFDRVFRCHCSTRQVYEEGAKAVVLSALAFLHMGKLAVGNIYHVWNNRVYYGGHI